MLLFKIKVLNYSEILNILNKKVRHIEGGIFHDEIGHYRKTWSDVDVVTSFGDNIVP